MFKSNGLRVWCDCVLRTKRSFTLGMPSAFAIQSSSLHDTVPLYIYTSLKTRQDISKTISLIMEAASAYFATKAHQLPSFKELGLLINKSKRAAAIAAGLRGAATSCIDQDDSGTYDPKLERRTPPPVRTTWLKKLNDDEEAVNEKQQKRWRPPKGYRLLAKFYFEQGRGMSYLRSIAPEYDSVSKHIEDSVERSDNVSGSESTSSSSEFEHKIQGRKAREYTSRFDVAANDRIEEASADEKICDQDLLGCNTGSAKHRLSNAKLPNGKKRTLQTNHEDQVKCEQQSTRRFISCNQCREAGSRCSLKSKQDDGPCTRCKNAEDSCRFLKPFTSKKASDSFIPERNPAPYTQVSKSNGLQKNVKRREKKSSVPLEPLVQRETAFIHPIKFNYAPKSDCDFHTSIFYGLSGFEPRRIAGRWLPNGRGFQEISKVNHGDTLKYQGGENTKMCVDCTTARIVIISCPCHNVIPLTSTEQNPLVHSNDVLEFAFAACLDGHENGAGALITNAKFCSICPNPATHQCREKCGLLLCDTCTGYLLSIKRATIGGKDYIEEYQIVDYIIKEVKKMAYKHPGGLRADAEFLTNDGELLYRIDCGMPIGVSSPDDFQPDGAIDSMSPPSSRGSELAHKPHRQVGSDKYNPEKQVESGHQLAPQRSKSATQGSIANTENVRNLRRVGDSNYDYISPTINPFRPNSMISSGLDISISSQTNSNQSSYSKPPKAVGPLKSMFGISSSSSSKAHHGRNMQENQTQNQAQTFDDRNNATNDKKPSNGNNATEKLSVAESIKAARRELGLPPLE